MGIFNNIWVWFWYLQILTYIGFFATLIFSHLCFLGGRVGGWHCTDEELLEIHWEYWFLHLLNEEGMFVVWLCSLTGWEGKRENQDPETRPAEVWYLKPCLFSKGPMCVANYKVHMQGNFKDTKHSSKKCDGDRNEHTLAGARSFLLCGNCPSLPLHLCPEVGGHYGLHALLPPC